MLGNCFLEWSKILENSGLQLVFFNPHPQTAVPAQCAQQVSNKNKNKLLVLGRQLQEVPLPRPHPLANGAAASLLCHHPQLPPGGGSVDGVNLSIICGSEQTSVEHTSLTRTKKQLSGQVHEQEPFQGQQLN